MRPKNYASADADGRQRGDDDQLLPAHVDVGDRHLEAEPADDGSGREDFAPPTMISTGMSRLARAAVRDEDGDAGPVGEGPDDQALGEEPGHETEHQAERDGERVRKSRTWSPM